MEAEEILREKHRFLKLRLKKYPFVKFKDHSLKNSFLEAVFSRGDRHLNQVLLESWRRGARFDSWKDLFKFQIWIEAFESENIDYHLYLQALKKNVILPWDHIDTGIKKSHFLKELEKALKEESTLSCLEASCKECKGCSFSSLVEKKFTEKVQIPEESCSFFGQKTETIFRYQAFYSKRHTARYISHIDLNNVIQRSFRRAGITIVHSKGFHPKMIISYLPALPLGMEGKNEVLEFKTLYLFSEKGFISQINKYLPSGVEFFRLRKAKDFEPSLHANLKTFVYSVDLESQEIKKFLDEFRRERKNPLSNDWEVIETLVYDFLKEFKEESLERVYLDKASGKLFLYLAYSSQKSIRPQEIVEKIFRVKNPVFIMAREKILFIKLFKLT